MAQEWPRDMRADALHWYLHAHAAFPNSRRDVRYFLQVIGDIGRRMDDKARALESRVFRDIMNSVNKRKGREAVAGVVAFSYLHLHSHGIRPSLERASLLASDFCYEAGKGFVEGDAKGFKLNADQATVKSIFREYRSTAHICAAKLSLIGSFGSKEEDALAFWYKTLQIKQRLAEATDVAHWNLISIPTHISIIKVPPVAKTYIDPKSLTSLMSSCLNRLKERGSF